MSTPALHEVETLIGHDFARSELLVEALTPPSSFDRPPHGRRRSRRSRPRHYERLEWLGDRVLNLVIADLLWFRFPDEAEGLLTLRYSSLVRESALARVAKQIGVDRCLKASNAPVEVAASTAVLADMCEAVVAAVYLDGGFATASELVRRLWAPLIDEMAAPVRSAKTRLQEWSQARGLGLPDYSVIEASGPAHAMQFTIAASVRGAEPASATASSKQQAQEEAASLLLEKLVMAAPAEPKRSSKR